MVLLRLLYVYLTIELAGCTPLKQMHVLTNTTLLTLSIVLTMVEMVDIMKIWRASGQ